MTNKNVLLPDENYDKLVVVIKIEDVYFEESIVVSMPRKALQRRLLLSFN